MKKFILLISFFTPIILYCQNTHDISFRITDSVVIKKNYPYATKINLKISVPELGEVEDITQFQEVILQVQYIYSILDLKKNKLCVSIILC